MNTYTPKDFQTLAARLALQGYTCEVSDKANERGCIVVVGFGVQRVYEHFGDALALLARLEYGKA